MTDDDAKHSGRRPSWSVERWLLIVVVALQCAMLWSMHKAAPSDDLAARTPPTRTGRTSALPAVEPAYASQPVVLRAEAFQPRRTAHVFDEIDAMFEQVITDFERMDRLFDFGRGWERIAASPTIDMNEDDYRYLVSVCLPGARASDVEVALDGRLLTVRGVIPVRRHAGLPARGVPVERRVMLPGPVDEDARAQAAFTNGTLRIVVPKALPAAAFATPAGLPSGAMDAESANRR